MLRKEPGQAGREFLGGHSGPKLPALPGRFMSLIIVLAIAAVLLVAVVIPCFDFIGPNEYGIKEVRIGVKRGIHEKVYSPGYNLVLPFGMERMYHLPRTVQVLEMTDLPPGETKGMELASHAFDKSAKIQTSDGFYVDVDVCILYRINDPYKVLTTIGPDTMYLENGIRPKAEPILKQALGELTTEDFYNSKMRVEKTRTAQELLNTELELRGMHVDHVLIRYFKYSDEIQKNIEAKKLQDQLVFKNQAEAKAAIENANLKRVTQEGEMDVKVTLEEGRAYKVKKDADRDLYTRKKKAEGDLLAKVAEAKRTELKNEAMQLQGSDRMVAMQMAEVLEGMDTIVVPVGGTEGFNPLDLDHVIRLFGLPDTASPPGPPPPPPPPPPAPAVAPPAAPAAAPAPPAITAPAPQEVPR